MRRKLIVQLLVTLTLSSFSIASAAISPTAIEATTIGDVTYFRVELPLPSDARTITVNPWDRDVSGAIWPATLASTPVHDVLCYMQFNQPESWSPLESSNVFYGKAKSKAPLKLELGYQKTSGEWATEEVSINFDRAKPIPTRTVTLDTSSTPTDLSVSQQFAHAQSTYFQMMSQLIPDDAGFFAYARIQALRQAGLDKHFREPDNFNNINAGSGGEVLYETATGSRAIQETLQADRLINADRTTRTRSVDISNVEPVQTKSHPWTEMLKGKTPKFSEIARRVPQDQYMLHFTSIAKLEAFAAKAQEWGASLTQRPQVAGNDATLRTRFQKQICLPSMALSQLLGPAIVKEVAITGSDFYFRDGTDVTIIFETVSPELFKAAVDPLWKEALAKNREVDTATSNIAGLTIEKIVAFDRSVSAYRVFDGNTVIYSNSPVALAKVLKTRSAPETSLASALDYQYMRTIWPQDAASEDGFLYLSDPFIRHLVGPETKIKEKRRVVAAGALRMIMNAAMLDGYLNGHGPTPRMDQLIDSELIEGGDFLTIDGKVTWNHQTAIARNEVYGSTGFMTPLCELSIDKVTTGEHEGYNTFRNNYESYWRRYFDPIGVRIKIDKTVSLDTYILPLIDESAYNSLKEWTGDEPATFDLAKLSTSTLVRWQVRLDPDATPIRQGRQQIGSIFGRDSALFEWLGEWAAFWVDDSAVSAHLFGDVFDIDDVPADDENARRRSGMTGFFELPIAAGIDVKNPLSLAAFLVSLQGMLATAAPNLVQFVPQDPYKGTTLVKVSPAPGGSIEQELAREAAAADGATSRPDLALYYGAVGKAWYISTKEAVLRSLIDNQSSNTSGSREIEYSAALFASPENAVKARPAIEAATAALTRRKEREVLRRAWLLHRCGLVHSADELTSAAQTWLGGPVVLPSGGTISFDEATGQAVSSAYGPMHAMKPATEVKVASNPLLNLFNKINHVYAWLCFTDDGLMTHLEMEQK